MDILGHYFELTLNILATPFCLGVVGALIVWVIKRIITKKEERDKERHQELVGSIVSLKADNAADHIRIFNKWGNHERRISFIEGVHNIPADMRESDG